MKALILAGGQGTRLWPLSRKFKPKQFQRLIGNKTMLQKTAQRLLPMFSWSDIFISTNQEYLGETKKELRKIAPENIVAEPVGRERIAAILFFIAQSAKKIEKEPLLVLASDHSIRKEKNFLNAVAAGEKFIKKHPDYLVLLVAKPTFYDTGLGYCQIGSKIADIGSMPVYKALSFKEKPNLKRARDYVASGEYFWNTAIYVFYPELLQKLVKKFVPDNYSRFINIKKALKAKNDKIVSDEYSKMDKVSLEYSVIENYNKIALIPVDLDWSDVGSWAVLKNSLAAPGKSFVKGNYVGIDSKNVMVYGSSNKLVAGVGIKDLVIAVTEDIILVCNHKDSQRVKQVIQKLEKQKKFNYI